MRHHQFCKFRFFKLHLFQTISEEKFNHLIFGGNGENSNTNLNEDIIHAIMPIMEKWSSTKLSRDMTVYGVRRYLDGAWLSLHVDRTDTHVLSAILQESKL